MMVLVLVPISLEANPFTVPNTPTQETLSYSSKISRQAAAQDVQNTTLAQRALRGEMASRIDVQIERKMIEGARTILYTRIEQLMNGNRAQWQFTFDAVNHLVMHSFKKKITAQDGTIVREEYVNFRAPVLGYPEDLLHTYVLEYAFRGVDFKEGYTNLFPVYFTGINIINMDIEVMGKEEVVVPAGKFVCWKVEMRPHLEDWVGRVVANLLRSFTPNFIFWYSINEGHPMVKYQGILGAIGAPVQVQELVSVQSASVGSTEAGP
jgi:hypothetical protein